MKKIFYFLLSAVAVIGLSALALRLVYGMKTTNLTSELAWGMWVACYIYFIGLSAGSFLMSSLVYVFNMHEYEKLGRVALVSALFALFAGMTFVWIDLGHPWRAWHVFAYWQSSSVLAWESLFYIFYIIIILAELRLLMRCELARAAADGTGFRRTVCKLLSVGFQCPADKEQYEACHAQSIKWVHRLGIIGIPVAIGVHGGTGALFAVVAAKPYWFSGLFPIIFLVSALVSGTGLMLFLYAFLGKRDEDHPKILAGLARFMVTFIALDILLISSDLLVGFYGAIPEHVEILKTLLFGPYWYVFWIGEVGMVMVLPQIIANYRKTKNSPTWLGIAGLSIVIGIVAVRLNLVIPAYIIPQLPGLDTAYVDHRLLYSYFPSLLEWSSSMGVIAAATLGFLVVSNLLPVFEEWKVLK